MSLEGQQLGRYRLLRLIGSGGMGEVYLAEDPGINRQVAIKVIRAEIAPYPATNVSRATALFQREAKAVAMLDHPHILPLYDYGEQKRDETTLTYLVTPYRPEGSLASWLQRRGTANPLSLQDIEHIVQQAASALQYAHDHQLIHQDVKPSNFLIRMNKDNPNRPDLLLTDFGIARLSTLTSGASQSIRGTPGYMAPEQWEGHPVPASDQYALAMMAYELLTGRSPFQGNPMQMMYAHIHTQPQAPSSINPRLSPAIDTVILRALAKEPEDRFPSISAFASAEHMALQGSSSATFVRASNPDLSTFVRASNPDLSTSVKTPNTPGGADLSLSATLAISEAEARNGTNRTLTLPGGRRVTVSIPPGAQNGQVIDLSDPDDPTSGSSPGILRLTLSVVPVTKEGDAASRSGSERTGISDASTVMREGVDPTNRPMGPGGLTGPTIPVRNEGRVTPQVPQAPMMLPDQAMVADEATRIANAGRMPAANDMRAAPYQQYPALPQQPIPEQRREPSRNRAILWVSVIVLLLLVSGSIGLFYYLGGFNSGGGSNANATATAQAQAGINATNTAQASAVAGAANDATATAIAQKNAAANATATAVAQANAQATVAANATATAVAQANANATATAIANANPYGGTLTFSDPLADNTHGWCRNISNTEWNFNGGVLHIIDTGATGPSYVPCIPQGTTLDFSNFAYQVQMKVLKGFGGGILFRSDSNVSQYYYFLVGTDGSYSLNLSNGSGPDQTIKSASSPAINTGVNQTNLVAVVAQGSTLKLYVNQQFITSVDDGSYTQGTIGLFAYDSGHPNNEANPPVEVVFSNVKVWT